MYILKSRRLLEIGRGTGTDGSQKTVRTAQDRLLHATYGINYFTMPTDEHEDLDNQVFKCDHLVTLLWLADQKQLFLFIGPYTVGCTSSTVPCTDRCTTTLCILLNSGCLFDWYTIINPTFFFLAILENLANFSTQRTKSIRILKLKKRSFKDKSQYFVRKTGKICQKKLESQASQKNYSFSHLCSNFYIQLPFHLYKYTHSKLKYA